MRNRTLLLALFVTIASVSLAQKKPLTPEDWDSWKSVAAPTLARDGRHFGFAINPQDGDGTLYVKSSDGSAEKKFDRGTSLRFSTDSRFATFTVVPSKADVEKARKEKKAPKDQPKNSFVILNLATGQHTTLERVKTVRFGVKDAGWVAYQLEEPPTPPKTEAKPEAKPPADNALIEALQDAVVQIAAASAAPAQEPKKEEPKKEEAKKKKEHTVGSEWIIRRLSDGHEFKIADVADLSFNENGSHLLYSVSTKTGEGDGLFLHDLAANKKTVVASGLGQYKLMSIHKRSGNIAFLTDRDQYKTEPTEWTLHLWTHGREASTALVKNRDAGFDPNLVLVARGALRFSFDGTKLQFPIGEKPEPEAKPDDSNPDEKPVLDVWSHTDKMLMSQQLIQVAQLRNRTMSVQYDFTAKKCVQLEDETVRNAVVGDRGSARYAIGIDDQTHSKAGSWGADFNDIYVIDTQSGVRKKVFSTVDWSPQSTVDGRYMYWFDWRQDDYFSYELATGRVTNVTESIPFTLINLEDDHPGPRPPAGPAMPTDDGRILIGDGYDLWLCDPSGRAKPNCLTDQVGRNRNWTFMVQNFPREDDRVGLNTSTDLYLRVSDNEDYDTGFSVDSWSGNSAPKPLVFGPATYGISASSPESDALLTSRMTFTEYPNLWITNRKFETPRQVSDANPQQKDYNWGTSELVHWTSTDGVPLKGVLIKPENFDPSKKYPMIVYFYEISSNDLHQHRVPSPSASTINPTEYASNGYLVFMPDIVYNVGFPGEGAEKCVLPGVSMLLTRGYVNPKAMAIQGQSWGGYQVMHLITRTKMFAAAGAGAAVSNMFSAYGGIREGSGLVRQFQYEVGQSRIGGSMWEMPLRYVENSPIFWADKVETPVLMMNNDKDDAVPYSQGVEMFTALRRLGKAAWMLNYNNDRHNLMRRANRKDLSIRMMQFFDHYLKGAPAPKWMTEGLPATKKGKDLGYELVKKP